MKIELDGRKYNLNKLGGAKAALRRVSELRDWVNEGGELSFDIAGEIEEPTRKQALSELNTLIDLLRQKVRAAKKVRKQAKKAKAKPQKPTKAEQQQSDIDAEISRLMIVKIEKEAEDDAILTLLLS